MNKIAIVTDSSCDLPDEVVQEYDIKILPLRIIYSSKEYRDRVEISAEEVYGKLEEEIPKTSLPSPEDVTDLFERLKEEGYTHVLGLFISSGLSGTYNMVKNLTDSFKELEIKLLDAKNLSIGLGFIVLQAAKEIKISNDFLKAYEKAEKGINNSKLFFVLKTLDYLRKGGRIGVVEGTIGELLGIKPVISVDEEGKYYSYTKVRGRKKSIEELYKIAKEKLTNKRCYVAVMHGYAEKEASNLLERIKEIGNVEETFFGQISPVLGVHTGSGLIGLGIFEV
ncbi:DegV family protein [Crassaminicella profunda]|uniref:DegV family protein n=1 Tax=Crassaminicella profunda TaxID=1286698 RepID=UPI001CA7A7F7|nr:DegV family protein [Crassaminicella profunda]QZY56275.1 DegV family protein [Crassaminicella profunda]